jgi:hypothetical protein
MQKTWAALNRSAPAAQVGVSFLEVAALGCALFVSAALYLARGYGTVAWIAPPSIAVILGLANWMMIRRDADALWTPLFSFRLASVVFFGFGGILSENLSAVALANYQAELPYTEREAAYVFIVWLAGVFTTSFGYYLFSGFAAKDVVPLRRMGNPDSRTLSLGILFTGAGLAYAYLVRLPIELGLLPIRTIPAAVSTPFDASVAVGVFLLSLWGLKKKGVALLVIPAVIISAAAVGLVLLTKQGVLLPLIFFGLAVLFARITALRLALVAGMVIFAFSILQPMVAYARSMVSLELALDPGERMSHMADYLTGEASDSDADEVQVNFLRFGHTHVAAFIIDRYEHGMPSNELAKSLTALVPRVIWPEKPIVTQGASDLYFLVSGREGSALAATTYADLYWNGGWTATLILGFIWGGLMFVGTRQSLLIVRQRDWYMMPFVLLMFMIGLSQESAFTVSILVPTVMAIIAFAMLRGVRGLFQREGAYDVTAPSIAGRPGRVKAISSPWNPR